MRALVIVGGAALLIAVATDFLAVVGRHIGVPLLGSIEVVQAAVLVAASAAIVVATIERRHAVVHLLTNRLSPEGRGRLARLGDALGALLFAAFLAGAAWIAADMWQGHEESELVRIPFAPLRLIEIAALAAVAMIFAIHAIRRRPR
jgi:TRAP-type C4-dicarboxylate transport system permease small subunit